MQSSVFENEDFKRGIGILLTIGGTYPPPAARACMARAGTLRSGACQGHCSGAGPRWRWR